MFSYQAVKDDADLFLTMTSLTVKEFQALLGAFQNAWARYVDQHFVHRKNRQRSYGGGRKVETLILIEDKLLFILYYFKTYPLQAILAFEFGMDQSSACDWIHLLSPILKNALADRGYLPERVPAYLAEVLSDDEDADTTYGIDGVERRRQRPKDNETQKQYYSGKKKTHTLKNNVMGNLNTRRAHYLSQTYEGKKHDKKIADEEQPTYPEGINLAQDTGFQGYEPAGVNILQPKKKPRGGELTAEEKDQNRLISRIRIVIEHIISGIKRCRIVKEVFRNTKAGFDDLVMEIACGLHNFRTEHR